MSTSLKDVLVRRRKEEMVRFLKENPAHFDDAMQLALLNERHLSWRAAWLVCGAIKKNDPQIKPYVHEIIQVIPHREDGHQRELLKILFHMNLEEDFEGLLFDLCVELWKQVRKQSSVRYYAFQGMMKVVKKHPELKNEILSLTQPHFVNALSPGIKKGINKSINELKS